MSLSPDRIKEAEFVRHAFRVTVPNDVKYDEVLKPEFWVHVAAKMNGDAHDLVEVMPEDGSWFALLIVVSASRLHAKCLPLLFKTLEAEAAEKDDGPFVIKHNGPCLLYTSDAADE